MPQKVWYAYTMIDTVINIFSNNKARINFLVFDNSIITLVKRGFCSGLKKTSHVDSLERFSKAVSEKVYIDIESLKKIS